MTSNFNAPNTKSSAANPELMSKGEKVIWTFGFALFLLLKFVYPFVLRFDSDEAQHLHVVWAWTQGLVQYRDVFDNHTPLFHILLSPLAWVIGEHPYILIFMRLWVIPMCGLTLFCVYRISRALFTARTALWTVLATGLIPIFFFTSTEFRADDLWIVFWMLSLLCLLSRNKASPFWTGFFMGCAFATSMKTSLLLGSILLAGVCVLFNGWILNRARRKDPSALGADPQSEIFALNIPNIGRALSGFALVPLLLIAFFYSTGAIQDLYYCVIEHNVVPGMGNSKLGMHSLRFPIAFPFLLAVGFALLRYSRTPGIGARRALVFLTGGIFLALFRSYWPLVTSQSYLPFIPLAAIMATPVFLWIVDRVRPPTLRTGALALATLVCFGNTVKTHPFWEIDTQKHVEMLSDVLKLTTASETVMDAKGETVFRKRAFYYALEGITLKRMELGLIPNTIIERLIQTQTAVVNGARMDKLKDDTKAFVTANYRPAGTLQILGKILNSDSKETGASYQFTIAIPADYELVHKNGPVQSNSPALINGTPWSGPLRLEPGKYEVTIAEAHGPLAVFWARAVDKGYSPF